MMKKCLLVTVIALFALARIIAQLPDFKLHFIEKDAYWITSAQQTTLSDIDNDGDLDFTTGNVHQSPSLFWYEYINPDKWIKHVIGSDDDFYGGADAFDADGDGRIDIVSGEYLFINKLGEYWPKGIGWDKYKIGTSDHWCHDLVVFDVNRDGIQDIITNSGKTEGEGLCWYEVGTDPKQPWTKHEIGGPGYRIHAGTSPQPAGDLDDDGDIDIAASAAWFENIDGEGTEWKTHWHNLIGQEGPWGMGTKTHVIDMDNDGDLDIVQAECDLREKKAGLGWLENDRKGKFKVHWLSDHIALDDFHSLYVFDYDNDGDPDVMAGNGPLATDRKTFIYENLAGKGNNPTSEKWKQHVILDGFVAHDGVVGDVDGDGDMDIVSKEWTSGSVYYLENRLTK